MRSSDLCGPIDVAIVDRQISRSSESCLNDQSIVCQSDPSHSVFVVSPFVRSSSAIQFPGTNRAGTPLVGATGRGAARDFVACDCAAELLSATRNSLKRGRRRAIPFSLAPSFKTSDFNLLLTAFVGCVYSGLYPK